MKSKKIAITIGDPAGIGPEIVLKAIMSHEITGICEPVIVGDRAVIEEAIGKLGLPAGIKDLELIDTSSIKDGNFQKNKPTAEGGRACASYIKKAVELALNKSVDAVVTAPISKEALKMAGFKWPGHTEMLAELTNTKDFAMMFYSEKLKVILVTIHTALSNVPDLIKKEKVLKTIILAKKSCDMLDIKNPLIAVSGLNPHAGESGIFGNEEIKEIAPAIEEAQNMGIPVSGPYPADTLFHRAYNGEFDIIVCMYHDQGLTPFKMIAFEKGVNMTVGLPIIRTSPDHGTACDIAWKGIANPSSIIEAIKLAARV
ncbi:MAG TPA: 4-hydroxythreonine-4-phosphate dehydrogenase PdxA, partial [Nitrospiraceae bacterium]|nr:4-hydroxythreonine-4-phosphate dehydrogenase PdxA [Nitrospiraceae bacterium]HCL81306.1 4-hydroxythreonine-4-phosphate dehydrogenase PdxA [Nitrospiraceae bacterium]